MTLLRSLAVLACLCLAACAAPRAPREPVALAGLAYRSMGWQVKVAALPAGMSAAALQAQLQQLLDQADAVLSTFRPESELMRFNRSPVGEWVEVSPLLLQSVQLAVEVSAVSAGAYDITVGPLVELWGFGATAAQSFPQASALAAARQRVGWRHIAIDLEKSALMRRADISLDLSSLGEGAAVDALADFLERQGMHDYLVAVAGTLRAGGRKADGSDWIVAIEVPDGSGRPLRKLGMSGRAVSTSGAYRHYRDMEGRRHSHTLDPRTGYPVTHPGVSVTVIAPAGVRAARVDALATAFNVLGPASGLRLAERAGLAVFYVEKTATGFRETASRAFAPDLAAAPE